MKLTTDHIKQQECVARTIDWLHQVWELTERGRPIQPDPFYDRNALLTPEVVRNVIDGIENLFRSELIKFPAYHREAQGIAANEYLVPPGFDTLPYNQQLALVQGVDRILQQYEAGSVPPQPVMSGGQDPFYP
jgi:hypothetical protein